MVALLKRLLALVAFIPLMIAILPMAIVAVLLWVFTGRDWTGTMERYADFVTEDLPRWASR